MLQALSGHKALTIVNTTAIYITVTPGITKQFLSLEGPTRTSRLIPDLEKNIPEYIMYDNLTLFTKCLLTFPLLILSGLK